MDVRDVSCCQGRGPVGRRLQARAWGWFWWAGAALQEWIRTRVSAVCRYFHKCVTRNRDVCFPGTQLPGANGRLVTVINDERDVATVAARLNGATCTRACTSLLVPFCLIPQVNAATYLQPCTLNGFSLSSPGLHPSPPLFFFFC